MDKVSLKSNKEELIKKLEFLQQRVSELEETEDRYRTLIELGTKIGEAIIMLQDADGKEGMHTYVSSQWPQITGYSKEELLGMSFFDLVIPKDKDISIKRHRQKMSGKTIPDLFELTIICKDSKEVPVEVTSAATNYRGENANVAYIRDIKERKSMEENLRNERDKYQSLFENVPIAVFESDLSELKIYIDSLLAKGVKDLKKYWDDNEAELLIHIKRISTYNSNKVGRSLHKINPKDSQSYNVQKQILSNKENADAIKNNFIKLSKGATHTEHYTTYITPEGDIRYHYVQDHMAKGCESDWSRDYVCITDITELKKYEIELLDYKANLEKMVETRTRELEAEIKNRLKAESKLEDLLREEGELRIELEKQIEERAQFMRLIAHEMKTPIATLLASSDLINETLSIQQIHRLIKQVNENIIDLSDRVNELFDLAKGEIGMLHLMEQEIKPEEMLTEILERFDSRAKQQGVELCGHWPSNLPTIRGDRQRIKQVIINLIDNALKNTRQNGNISLKVQVQRKELLIEVNDTGKGISDRNLDNIFKPYQKHNGTNAEFTGMGLGLALSKMLVELHGGHIWVLSKEGAGSNFGLSLPLKK